MIEKLMNPILLPVLFPLAAGVVCLLIPKALERVCAFIALLSSAIAVFLVWPLFRSAGMVFEYGRWISLKVDALSGFVLLATAVFGFLIALYSTGSMSNKKRQNEYYAYLLWTTGVSCGAVLANEFILLLIFWGFLGLTLYLMTGMGGPGATTAAKKSFIVIGASDSILILGIGLVWILAGTTRMDAVSLGFSGKLTYAAFICFAIGAFTKAGAMPFHSWVPDCGEKAPASVAAFLPASLDKLLGIYLLARVSTEVFVMNGATNTLLMIVGAGTIILAVMMALVQHDMKRLLSYHAVSQVGYMILGIGTGIPVGIAGGLFHMLNNAMYKSCLFLCAGSAEEKAGTSDLDRMGGLARAMPITFFSFFVAAASISGIPPLNGFVSKWMVYQGIIESGKNGGSLWVVWLAAAMLGSALTVASFVKVLHAVFLRKPQTKEQCNRSVSEVSPSMWLPTLFLAVMCILFGVLAYRFPLRMFILPIFEGGVLLPGTWWAGPATAMLILAFSAGFVLYLAGTMRKARVCPTYIGGEKLDETYISGRDSDVSGDMEVSGVDFYLTVQNLFPLKGVYKLAEKKLFDIYEQGSRLSFFISDMFKKFHTGVLTTYVGWYVAGIIIVFLILTR